MFLFTSCVICILKIMFFFLNGQNVNNKHLVNFKSKINLETPGNLV